MVQNPASRLLSYVTLKIQTIILIGKKGDDLQAPYVDERSEVRAIVVLVVNLRVRLAATKDLLGNEDQTCNHPCRGR